VLTENQNSHLFRKEKKSRDIDASARAFPCCRFPGSTPLHLAARGGSLDCVRQLLSWGADRLQRDSVGCVLSQTFQEQDC
jgi:ankyrin repeat protein